MILTNIINTKRLSPTEVQLSNTNIILKNFAKQKQNFNNINTKKILSNQSVKQVLTNYIINIQTSQTNTLISVTDIKGKTIISLSSGSLKLKKKQKKTQPLAIMTILKHLILKVNFLYNKIVVIHFKNVKIYYESVVIKLLSNILFIKSIKSYNLSPHNGCRPKKLKRFKQRT